MDLKFKTMKKLLLAATFAATFSLSAIAADNSKKFDDTKNVSYFVLNQFSADFDGAQNVNWTITPTTQKADFTTDGVKKTAFYSLTGTYLGLTEEVDYKLVPTAAKKQIEEDYKGYKIGQVIKFAASDAEPAYGAGYAVDQPESLSYFVDLKSVDSEVLVRVSSRGGVYFFKQIK
jgi:opacity protein-like surface antigen